MSKAKYKTMSTESLVKDLGERLSNTLEKLTDKDRGTLSTVFAVASKTYKSVNMAFELADRLNIEKKGYDPVLKSIADKLAGSELEGVLKINQYVESVERFKAAEDEAPKTFLGDIKQNIQIAKRLGPAPLK